VDSSKLHSLYSIVVYTTNMLTGDGGLVHFIACAQYTWSSLTTNTRTDQTHSTKRLTSDNLCAPTILRRWESYKNTLRPYK